MAVTDDAAGGTPWRDRFVGWIARSYSRATLPDNFNRAFSASKLPKVFDEKLARKNSSLFGIYLRVDSDSETPWQGEFGLMPGPYILGVLIITEDSVDPTPLLAEFKKQVFEDKVDDPDTGGKTTREQLARRAGIRMLEEDFDARTTAQVSISNLRSGWIRYTFVDYLSDASIAAPFAM